MASYRRDVSPPAFLSLFLNVAPHLVIITWKGRPDSLTEAPTMRVTLSVTEGPHQGRQFSFSDHQTFLVGRSKRCHFQLPKDDKYFSRVHFMIEVNPPQVALTDMDSRNKTFVNGKEASRVNLKNGDEIRAGRTVIQVAVAPTPAPPVPPPPPVAAPKATRPTVPVVPTAAINPIAPIVPTVPFPPIVPAAPAQPIAPVASPLPPPLPVTMEKPPSVVVLIPEWFNGPSQMIQLGPGCCPTCGLPLPEGPEKICPHCIATSAKMTQTIPGYRIVRELGRGSMGIVSLALREADGKAYAMKTIIPSVSANQAVIDRFLREAHILRQLQHPYIVGLRDEGEIDGMLYFAMDYVHGTDASRLLKREGPLDIKRALRLVCPMLEALGHAHERKFVHRDVKPSNLLVSEGTGPEVVRLADFGLARVYQASEMSGLTFNGDIGGTVAFMPPEQITEYRDAKPPADQYAAAASLYNLLTNKYVYDLPEGDFPKQLRLILNEDTVPILKRRRDIPKAMSGAIHRALAREPEDRFPTAIAFREALRPFER